MSEPEVDFYLRLVNEEYKSVLAKPISDGDLVNDSPRTGVRPSSKLSAQISDATKQRFEPAFAAVNKLL